MKIAVAQTRPKKGDIAGNIAAQEAMIKKAASHQAGFIVFPELSITGYEPTLAGELATTPGDKRLTTFQNLADVHKIIIGVGLPVKNTSGVTISLVFFHPGRQPQTYSKKYLHADEEPFFVAGENDSILLSNHPDVTLAICYEISVPEHRQEALKSGASIYVASVAKSVAGVEKALTTLADFAARHRMTVLMANCVGPCDDFQSGGKSSAWDSNGNLIGQLSGTEEGWLVIDTETKQLIGKGK